MKAGAPEWLPFPVSTMDNTNVTIAYEVLDTGNEIRFSRLRAISGIHISYLNNDTSR